MGHHEGGIRLGTCEAQTRRQKSRTRVRRGDTRGMPLLVRRGASCHVFFFPRLALTRLKLSPIHAKSHRVSGKTAEMADSARNFFLKKKNRKKKVRNAPFELNVFPILSHASHFIQTQTLALSYSIPPLYVLSAV